MKRLFGALMLVIMLAWTASAPAQWFTAKKPKVNPTQRVPELILTVKTDPDERKRLHAAEELREYDAAIFNEIVPVLGDVLRHDKKLGVRLEALNSLAKIRPVSTLAGQAIEKSAADDEALRVRLQAKALLPKYHVALNAAKKAEASAQKKGTNEPPLIEPQAPARLAPPKTEPPLSQGPALFP